MENLREDVSSADLDSLRAELARQAELIEELRLSRAQKSIRLLRRNKRSILAGAIIGLIIPAAISALSITKTYTFTAGSPTVASEVNNNFDQLFTKVNDLAAFHPPIGTILAWHKDLPGVPALPATGEWVQCNGQTLTDAASPLNGQVIPNLNGDATGANSPGQPAKVQMFLRGGLTSGTGQQDAFQGHLHQYYGYGAGGGAGVLDAPPTYFLGNPTSTGSPTGVDGSNGVPRISNETRPVNMSVLWIMKIK